MEKKQGKGRGKLVYVCILYRVVEAGLIGWRRQTFEGLRN